MNAKRKLVEIITNKMDTLRMVYDINKVNKIVNTILDKLPELAEMDWEKVANTVLQNTGNTSWTDCKIIANALCQAKGIIKVKA